MNERLIAAAERTASRTEHGEVIFPQGKWEEFVALASAADALAAQPAAEPDALERMRHIANEWADMATNGLQAMRNVADGISTTAEALESLERNMAHCRAVNDAPGAYGSSAPVAAQPARAGGDALHEAAADAYALLSELRVPDSRYRVVTALAAALAAAPQPAPAEPKGEVTAVVHKSEPDFVHATLTAPRPTEYTLEATREEGKDWYITVTAENGMRDYLGYWKDSAHEAPAAVLAEAVRGACLGTLVQPAPVEQTAGGAVPAGFKLVPIHPTKDMIEAGRMHTMMADEQEPYRARGAAIACYSDMLAASPAAVERDADMAEYLQRGQQMRNAPPTPPTLRDVVEQAERTDGIGSSKEGGDGR